MTHPPQHDPWQSPGSSPNPDQPAPTATHTFHVGPPPARKTNTTTVLAIVGVVVLVCCGLGTIGVIGSSLTGGTDNDSGGPRTAQPATSSPEVTDTPSASPLTPAGLVVPSASPSPRPTPKQSSPTPRRTTSSPKPASKCDPNYADACVPIASDVDCGGGSGNGPAYFWGVARVVGSDIYDLDRDNDGWACEKN